MPDADGAVVVVVVGGVVEGAAVGCVGLGTLGASRLVGCAPSADLRPIPQDTSTRAPRQARRTTRATRARCTWIDTMRIKANGCTDATHDDRHPGRAALASARDRMPRASDEGSASSALRVARDALPEGLHERPRHVGDVLDERSELP